MKVLNFRNLFLSVSFLALSGASSVTKDDDLEKKFDDWVAKYDKQYSTEEEKLKRLQIWSENYDYIEQQNDLNLTYELGLNEHSDKTLKEFHQHYSLGDYAMGFDDDDDDEDDEDEEDKIEFLKTKNGSASLRRLENDSDDVSLPASVDWVAKGKVTPCLDQRQCASCWAFTAAAVLESTSAIQFDSTPVPMSEQELVDCSTNNHGCDGGSPKKAFKFLKNTKSGLCSFHDYPYVAKDEHAAGCSLKKGSCTSVNHSHVKKFSRKKNKNENFLKRMVVKAPPAALMDASQRPFQFYKSGVFTGECPGKLDHSVAVVGYNIADGYWLLKNSWGQNWGENGFMKLGIKSDNPKNVGACGVYKDITTVIAK